LNFIIFFFKDYYFNEHHNLVFLFCYYPYLLKYLSAQQEKTVKLFRKKNN